MWCAWGYERNFTLDEVIGTLPKVKEMGIKWATLDDGFQITEGDWTTNPQKFPNGAADMRRLTKAIHDAGLKAQIWWAPLAVSPDSRLLQEQPSVLLRTEEYAPQFITWWDAWYMAPTSPATLQHTKDVVTLFIQDWDFDGLKLDGQHLNAVLPDHGEGHGIENPEEACERLPDFFHAIYNTAAAIKPDVLVQHCPCGTCMSYYNLPTTNQTVSSDPVGSIQIRQKGKVYKAIAPQVAYFGDHVELSDGGNDFASSFGVGAVLGTKFTWPKDNPTVKPGYLLTPEKERAWKKWFSLYNEKMLSKEPYLGQLYDIGYDLPEAHAIQKGNIMYYAFYAEKWDGVLELRGLHKGKRYKVRDYINGKEWGQVTAENPSLKVAFEQSLLLEVSAL
jgi:alpha-galactosidase